MFPFVKYVHICPSATEIDGAERVNVCEHTEERLQNVEKYKVRFGGTEGSMVVHKKEKDCLFCNAGICI